MNQTLMSGQILDSVKNNMKEIRKEYENQCKIIHKEGVDDTSPLMGEVR